MRTRHSSASSSKTAGDVRETLALGKTVKENVSRLAKEKGILMKNLVVGTGTIQPWGKVSNPSADSLEKLAKQLEVSVDYLCTPWTEGDVEMEDTQLPIPTNVQQLEDLKEAAEQGSLKSQIESLKRQLSHANSQIADLTAQLIDSQDKLERVIQVYDDTLVQALDEITQVHQAELCALQLGFVQVCEERDNLLASRKNLEE